MELEMDNLILDLCQFESRCYSFISRSFKWEKWAKEQGRMTICCSETMSVKYFHLSIKCCNILILNNMNLDRATFLLWRKLKVIGQIDLF